MRITVNNLGAIKSGTIDLTKRINVFCGENGSGKTYFAYVLYGLFKDTLHLRSRNKYAETLMTQRKLSIEIKLDKISLYRTKLINSLENNVDSIFGIGENSVSQIFDGFKCSFDESEDDFKNSILNSEFIVKPKIDGTTIQLEKKKGNNQVIVSLVDKDVPTSVASSIDFLLDTLICDILATYPIRNVVIFPVERNSIYTFSKELSIRSQEALDNLQALFDKEKKINRFELYFNSSKRYALPIKDNLIIAEDLTELKKNKSDYYEFASELESELLHGEVVISEEGQIQFVPIKSKKKKLPIQMTASIVKTLSSLVVYLKYSAKKNDLLIIDEPEINLHPNNQVVLARLLTRLANNGFRLLVSTHSDYIIREFNNLVMLSDHQNEEINVLRNDFHYKEDEYINKEDIGVYYFKYKDKNSRFIDVEPLKINDEGFSVASIDDTIDKQNDISEKLYYALKFHDDE